MGGLESKKSRLDDGGRLHPDTFRLNRKTPIFINSYVQCLCYVTRTKGI